MFPQADYNVNEFQKKYDTIRSLAKFETLELLTFHG